MSLQLQKIPPKAAHLALRVENFLKQDLQINLQDKSLLISLSGGPDSTALLLILLLLKNRLQIKEVAGMYLDHGLREEARLEQKFLQNLAAKHGLTFFTFKTKVGLIAAKSGKGKEEIGRRIRYRLFDFLVKKYKFEVVCLGHHLNDLAEDFFMRLIRGTSWPKLGGMEAKIERKDFILLRPLLFLAKQELIEFLDEIDQRYFIDKTNEDLSFLRNRVRHTIMPLFLRENPLFLKNIFKIWQLSRLEREELQNILGKVKVEKISKGFAIDKKGLLKESSLNRLRIISFYLEQLGEGQLLFDNLLKAENLIKNNKVNKFIQFPGKKKVRIDKNKILILKNEE